MPYLLDGILIVCILLFLAIGIHRGFAKSLVGLIGTIAAVVLAVGLSGVVAQWVYSSFFQPSLMQSLQEAQTIFGYVPEEVQIAIADGLGVTLSEVYGVSTFYSQFSLEARGRFVIGVCLGTACYVKGSQQILDKLEEKLGLATGSITTDGRFSLDASRCVGACGLAPVMIIDDDVYGRVTPDMVEDILAKYA